ncbi:hypothetical protein HF086_010160 [Spodoptera exigua]|uniref:Uncharacterized protein n=1 Tax=Spodoptera exigua TaxID=7107 RepID=A0A922MY13_SPOEX|nr:hypothetical protein HF086_010160 [Spodoptera exigua]
MIDIKQEIYRFAKGCVLFIATVTIKFLLYCINVNLPQLQAFLTLIRQMSRQKKGLAAEEEQEEVKKRGPCCIVC